MRPEVPTQFQQRIRAEYPPNNKQIFEEWFFDNRTFSPPFDRLYLPIFWTSYYVNHKYGKDLKSLRNLQAFIDSLDRSKKYFTILQYDDGILNDISKLDIKVFGSGGGRIDYPIPLVTMPHPYVFEGEKDVFCSFAGGITHNIRAALFGMYTRKPGYQMERELISIEDYCKLMSRSLFAMCPRGYGKSSFRICEALQFGAIPIYISDELIIPGHVNFNEYGVIIPFDQVHKIDDILKSISIDQIVSKQEAGKRIYEEMFTYTGCKQLILNNL